MPLFFWFDLFLEARAEILKKLSLVFWSKRWHQKYILKLTDLYKSSISSDVKFLSFLQILLVMGTFGNPKGLSGNSEHQRFEHYDFNYSRRYHFNFTIVKFGQILERPACHLCHTKIGKFCQYSSCFQE